MFHEFVNFYMVIINQILRIYAYINILLENHPKLVFYFHSYFSLNRKLLLFKKVWAVYARALGLSLPVFHQHYLTGMNSITQP